jgi:integrase
MALSDVKIRNAKAKAAGYRLTDSHGLSVEITPAGNKLWRYRYRLDGKENLFAAGAWCVAPAGEAAADADTRRADGRLTLAEARQARVTWRGQVKAGQHPRLVRATARLLASQSNASTFRAVAAEYAEKRGAGWGAGHRRRFDQIMRDDIFPELGDLPIATLGPGHVLAALHKIEARGVRTVAAAARSLVGQVFRFAVASHKAAQDPTRTLVGALAKHETRNYPPLARDQIGPFLRAIEATGSNLQTKIAGRLLLLTLVRTIELRGARWDEFSRDLWRIPPERMKKRRPHLVPISRQSAELLDELRPITGSGALLFPNVRDPGRPMGGSTLLMMFHNAGYGGIFSPHGFRSTGSTVLREAGFDSRVIELSLAHIDKNRVRASYDHAELLEPRRAMLQAWADMIDALLIEAEGKRPP